MTDRITCLRTVSGARLTKLWRADGTIEGYQDAKTFTHEAIEVGSLGELAQLLGDSMRLAPDACVIRGVYPPDAPHRVLRNTESTFDEPHHWVMMDVDGYEPLTSDPVREPEAACQEFILDRLPQQFHDRSFYWQLSSSAGAPGKEATLKAHLWFWLSEKADSVALRTWAKAHGHVDPAVFRQVQPHYTADPIFDGAADPVPRRADLAEGIAGDVVDIAFLGAIAPTSGADWTDASDIDLGKIKGAVPDYDIERVRDEVLAHLDPNMHHDEWVSVGMSLHHQFDGAPEALDLWDEWSSDGASWNEDVCAERWRSFKVDRTVGTGAVTLGSLIKKVRPAAQAVAHAEQPGTGHADKVLAALALKLGRDNVNWFESAISWSPKGFEDTLARMAYDTARNKFNILAPGADSMREFTDTQLVTALRGLGMLSFYDADALEEIITMAVQPAGMPGSVQIVGKPAWLVSQIADFKKETAGWFTRKLVEHCVRDRQFKDSAEVEDIFTERGALSLHKRKMTASFPVDRLPEGPVDAAVIEDYRKHFPQFDDFLSLLTASRLANDRKEAYLWLQAESNWGKSFLSGQLDRLGLVMSTTMDDLLRAASGAPSGMTPERLRQAWVLVVNEFKGVIGEVKSIENEISFSPKNRASVTVPLYLKLFMSAEDVPSLVGSETGADSQFVNRFMRIEGKGAIDARPLFRSDKAAYARSVRNHVAAFVNAAVDRARTVGVEQAAMDADAELSRLHAKYPLLNKDQGTLEQRLQEIADLFVADVIAGAANLGGSLSSVHRIGRDNAFVKDGVVYLQRGEKALADWLSVAFTKAEAGKVFFKRRQILGLLPVVQSMRNGAGQRVKAIRLGETGVAEAAFMD